MTTGRPGAAHIGLPYDVLKQPVDAAEIWAQDGTTRYPAWRVRPGPGGGGGGRRRASLRPRRPVFICGGGVVAAGATDVLGRRRDAAERPGLHHGDRQGQHRRHAIRSASASSD